MSMQYKINLFRPLTYRNRKRNYVTVAPGAYLVPEQMEAEVAALAVSRGIATAHEMQPPVLPKVEPDHQPSSPAPERMVQADPVSEGYVAKPTASAHPPQRRRRGKRRKGPAPENKIVHVPENKTSLV